MALEFGDDVCAACEPTAWIWHKGNGPNGRIQIDVVDVHLPEIHGISLVHQNIYVITNLLTALAPLMLSLTTKW